MNFPTAAAENINVSSSEEQNTPLSQTRSKAPSSPHAITNYYGSYLKTPQADLRVPYGSSKLQPKAETTVSDRKQLKR